MSGPLRRPTIPHCSACLRNYAFGGFDAAAPTPAVRSQVRGKKKMVNISATVPVRLLRDMPTFGKKGHLLPIPRGQMRNQWFPQRIASYITAPELRTLRLSGTPMERDFTFGEKVTPAAAEGTPNRPLAPWEKDIPSDIKGMSTSEIRDASAFQKAPVLEKISPERSMELVEIFVPKRLDFYRQPIIEEKSGAAAEEEDTRQKKPKFTMGGAAGDLLAARQKDKKVKEERQAIYGSVSTQDVLVAMRAAMGTNDEAARVVLHEEEIRFVDLPASEEPGRVKHVGDFGVEVVVKGAEEGVRRTVRVVAQEM